MKTLLFTILLTLSVSAFAGYRTIYVCEQSNCRYVSIYEYEPVRPIEQNNNNQNLMDNISNSGAKNYNQFQQNYNQAYDRAKQGQK